MVPAELPPSDETVPHFYVNAMGAEGGAYDVTIHFGQRIGARDVEWHARVTMSWEHARATVEALSRVVDEYQGAMGEIRKIEEPSENEQLGAGERAS